MKKLLISILCIVIAAALTSCTEFVLDFGGSGSWLNEYRRHKGLEHDGYDVLVEDEIAEVGAVLSKPEVEPYYDSLRDYYFVSEAVHSDSDYESINCVSVEGYGTDETVVYLRYGSTYKALFKFDNINETVECYFSYAESEIGEGVALVKGDGSLDYDDAWAECFYRSFWDTGLFCEEFLELNGYSLKKCEDEDHYLVYTVDFGDDEGRQGAYCKLYFNKGTGIMEKYNIIDEHGEYESAVVDYSFNEPYPEIYDYVLVE